MSPEIKHFITKFGEKDIIQTMLEMLDESIDTDIVPLIKFKIADSLEDAYQFYTNLKDSNET